MGQPLARNPFALLTNPEVVVQAMEASERLSRLRSRVCRPLDRQVGAVRNDDDDEVGLDSGNLASSSDTGDLPPS